MLGVFPKDARGLKRPCCSWSSAVSATSASICSSGRVKAVEARARADQAAAAAAAAAAQKKDE